MKFLLWLILLVHLLAAGPAGSHPVPPGLAASSPLPAHRDHRRRRLRPVQGDHHPAGPGPSRIPLIRG